MRLWKPSHGRLIILRIKVLLLLLFYLSSFIYAIEGKPLWVEFQEAKALYESGEFKEALNYFLSVTKGDRPFPEAEYMIGLLYLEEGELEIAEKQILKALENSHYLEVEQDILNYKYKLAEIYLLKEDYSSYVEQLKEIIGGDELNVKEIKDQKAFYDTLLDSGIDRLLHLYRKEADNVLNARVYLGYYYNSIGDYKRSVSYLLPSMLALITEVISDRTLLDREYIFTGMNDFFLSLNRDKRASTYFNEHDFYRVFYYLAESLYGLEREEIARDIWELMVLVDIESPWIRKANKQLREPELETWKLIY